MISGEPYHAVDPELFEMQAKATRRYEGYNLIPALESEARDAALRELFGTVSGWAMVEPPIYVDFGIHIHLGDRCFINTGAVFLDSAPVKLGERVFVGPRVQFITATHPVKTEERCFDTPGGAVLDFGVTNIAKPITVGSDCWIGAAAVIMPGVTIGAGTTVGACSLVTKSLPERVIAIGSRARIVRSVDD
jgi:maltose O-acetyltransferase